MKVIIFHNPDGGVCVVKPAPNFRLPDETENAFLGRVIQRSVPEGTSCQIVDESELPAYDSGTRDRWRMNNGRVEIGPETPKPPKPPKPPSEIDQLKAEIATLRDVQTGMLQAMQKAAEGRGP